jgi:hypothetical protein
VGARRDGPSILAGNQVFRDDLVSDAGDHDAVAALPQAFLA